MNRILTSLLISLLSFSAISQVNCIDFSNYTEAFFSDVSSDHATYPVGDAFITEGDLSLVKPDSFNFYQFIDTIDNEMCFINKLGIDVSSGNYNCRKLSFGIVAGGGLVVDGDTLNAPFSGPIYVDTVIYRPGFTATVEQVSGFAQYTIEGDFDYVEISTSTICINNICLENCSTDPSCLQIGNYTNAFMDEVTMNDSLYPPGSAFVTEGDIQLIKPSTGNFYQFIDSAMNQLCYIGALGIDVSSAAYDCRRLTYNQVAGGGLVIDGDTITPPFGGIISIDTTITTADYTVEIIGTANPAEYTIEGEFDYVEISTSTICISNICLESCSTDPTCMNFGDYSESYLYDVTYDHATYPPGTAFMGVGDLQLIKVDTLSFYQFIDTMDNEFCFIGALGFDVSTAAYNCRTLSWNQVAGGGLIVDGDTIMPPMGGIVSYDTTIVTSNYTVQITGSANPTEYIVQGDFDYVEISTSTICVSNVCVTSCDDYGYLSWAENAVPVDWNVYPNPAHDALNIDYPNAGSYDVLITDLQGRVLISSLNNTGIKQIGLWDIPNGLYLIILQDENGLQTVKKFVKE